MNGNGGVVFHPIGGLVGINECGCSVYSDGERVCIDA